MPVASVDRSGNEHWDTQVMWPYNVIAVRKYYNG